MDTSHIVILVLLAVVVAVLLAGIGLMARGGELNKKYGNKLMVARVVAQGLIVLALGLMFVTKH